MTFEAFLKQAIQQLRNADIPTARLDALVLMEDATGCARASILAHPEATIAIEDAAILNKKIAQRTSHTPLAYIRRKAEFFGREFAVNRHILVPRPETETIIEILKTLDLMSEPRIADIGTGSGCIGITAALELPDSTVDLYDIDDKALAVAIQNAQHLHAANVHCFKGDLLKNLRVSYNVLLANLPYVPSGMPINQAARHEPPQALFAGDDGMDVYRLFWQQLAGLSPKPAYVIAESLPAQHKLHRALAQKAGYTEQLRQGYVQLFTLL